MSFDLAVISGLVALALSSLNLIAHVRTMMSSGEKKLDDRLTKVELKLIEHDRRVQTIENEMKHLPDRDSQHRMELQLSDMNGKFTALEERLKPIAAVSIRLQEFMLDQANHK
jgi:Protein of unknown function (DUF2730)